MYRIYSEDGSPKFGYTQNFVVDNQQDLQDIIDNMPDLKMGSMAFCIENMEFYIFDGEGEWEEIKF